MIIIYYICKVACLCDVRVGRFDGAPPGGAERSQRVRKDSTVCWLQR